MFKKIQNGPKSLNLYDMDGQGFVSQWGSDFPCDPERPKEPPILLYNGYRDFPGSKAARAWCYHPLPSSAGSGMGRRYASVSSLCLHRHVMGWLSFTRTL